MTCVAVTKQKYDAIIIATGLAGPPLARRLSEAASALIRTMLEVLESSAA
jgi:choline dehydrogenase-like flavoprotein